MSTPPPPLPPSPAPPLPLSIIIVNWNTRELLAKCLQSVISSQSSVTDNYQLTTETFVVDNASTDSSAAMVRERFPWVRLIESQENLGFAGANNLALQMTSGEQILLLNPDTVITEAALTYLLQVMAGLPAAGVAGSQLLNADGSLQMSDGIFPSMWTEIPLINRIVRPPRRTRKIATPDGDLTVQSVDFVCGACLMIRRQVVDAVGPLDEDFWLYTEETDWCRRVRAKGWDVVLVPQSQIYHLARAASRQRFTHSMLHFYQSKVRFVYKHHGPVQASFMRKILWLKAAIWCRRPQGSPLRKAYPDLPDEQIVAAYRRLGEALALPLSDYLVQDWQ